MSIATYVENLRDKPEHTRRKVAFWWAFTLTAIVLAFYLASLGFANRTVRTSAASVADNISSPATSMIAGVGALGADLWSMIVGTKKVTYSEVIVTPGKN